MSTSVIYSSAIVVCFETNCNNRTGLVEGRASPIVVCFETNCDNRTGLVGGGGIWGAVCLKKKFFARFINHVVDL